ncbi:MAG: LuxR C-terminal-related transcriptional regulator [Leucobacter sp.]
MRQPESEERRREPLLRRASDRTPLGEVIGGIEYAYGTGDYEFAAELIERDALGAWYGFEPGRFGEMITVLARSGVAEGPFVGAVYRLLFPEDSAQDEPAVPASDAPDSVLSPELAVIAGDIFRHRLAGRPVEALRRSVEFSEQFGALQPLFDLHRGWGLFSAVQHGVTAMLSGDFSEALASFTQARMHVPVPHLAFLSRDACVKAALIEALYGEADRARALLDEADGIPRTESWAEAVIDAGQAIAASAVRAENPAEALQILDAVPLREIGEMWPFYIAAVQRAFLWAGDFEEARRRLARFERLPLPRVDGEGFTGSALLLAEAQNSLMQSDLIDARDRVERADESLAVTQILAAVLELAAGRPREALQRTAELREQTRELRALELWRLSVAAASHLALGAQDDCREVLEHVIALPRGVSPQEAGAFSAEVRGFAEAHLESWPAVGDETVPIGFDIFPMHREALSIREQEVLRALTSGRSREEIAKSQFISLNTLKAHLRAIYRKLDVNSRAAAVLEAERRGLV